MNILLFYSLKYQGEYQKISQALKEKEYISLESYQEAINNLPYKYISLLDKEYPEKLKKIDMPPYVLYYKGNIDLLKENKFLSIVGSRAFTSFGKASVFQIVPGLVENDITIISGLAKGIDSFAHQATLKSKGKTIAILGSGIEEVYPKENSELQKDVADLGLIISEYPGTSLPKQEHFPMRNRIIAGLANVIFVVEAALKSGTMITVRYALQDGKEVCCLPSSYLKKSGCNQLIKEGAILVEDYQDIIELFPNY
ncbi:MAG: DNA-processing protein DprA [Bacillales bacterium]|jgi:DNA processing protein|nr:DNA-processing protein DprA [Bacillales bacterium]